MPVVHTSVMSSVSAIPPWQTLPVLGTILVLMNLWTTCHSQPGSILQYRVFEEEAANRFVGNVKIDSKLEQRYSVEVLRELEFNFRYENGDYSLFTIDLKMGIIRTSRKIDREQICEYQMSCDIELDVKVTPVQYFEIIKVKVDIMDINDNLPTFPQQQISTLVAETTMPGALIPIPSADDKDSGKYGIEGYRIGRAQAGSENFDLQVTEHSDGSMDINIVLLNKLDREQEAFYTVVVYAYDGDLPQHSGSITVDVTVTDANDNSPKFDNSTYETTIFENLPFRSTILQVHAVDRDSGLFGEVVYSFAPSTLSQFGSLFGINNKTGEIYVTGLIDYESEQLYQLNVQAQDKGPNSLPTFAKVKIHVLDLNDHAPQININVLTASGNAEVLENVETGTFVAHVSVMDPDLGQNGLFDCEVDSEDFQLTALPGSTNEYKIVSRKMFDREKQARYHIVMTCEDRGKPVQKAVKQVIVDIMDENDNDPVFSERSYQTEIPENNGINAFIVKIDAEDRDAGLNAVVVYQIEGDSESTPITIDRNSGVIKAKVAFDYETRHKYEFVITASDRGNPSKTSSVQFILTIADVNDEYPVFSEDVCFFKIYEDKARDSFVGKMNATDADSDKYNNITYSIDPSTTGSHHFYITDKTGAIFTQENLDRETQDIYHLNIIAENLGYPSTRTRKDCTVHVLDVNDNSPVIQFPNSNNDTIKISNQLPLDHVVVRIVASDVDSDENGVISYAISGQSADGFFQINELSGDVSVAKSLSNIERQVIKVSVLVTDKGSPPRDSRADLNIIVDKAVAAPLAQDDAFLQNNLMVILGALLGLIFIIIIITVSLCAVKYRNRRAADKGAKYNCRLAANKSVNGGVTSSTGETKHYADDLSMKSDCSMDSPTKNKSLKKEVTFTFDHDEAYMQKSPGGRTLTQETSLSQESASPQFLTPVKQPRPSRQGVVRGGSKSPQRAASPDCTPPTTNTQQTNNTLSAVPALHRPVVNKYPHISDPRKYSHHPLGLRHYDRSPTHPTGPPQSNSKKLTERSLEMHDILNLSQHTDMDSECSNTDSGRGPSEEGEYLSLYSGHPQYTHPQYRIDPYYNTDSTNVKGLKDSKVSKTANNTSKMQDKYTRNDSDRTSIREQSEQLKHSPQRSSLRDPPPVNPLIKPQPLTVEANNQKLSPTKVNWNSAPVKDCSKDVETKPWDPLNHHTSKKPKQLDARDLIGLQTNYKQSPPIPPKRTPGITVTSRQDHSNQVTGSPKTDPTNTGHRDSTYDVPSSVKSCLFNNNQSPASSRGYKAGDGVSRFHSDTPNTSVNQPSSMKGSSDQFTDHSAPFAGHKKEVRFADSLGEKAGVNLETCSSNDGLSDGETCTSGSYILDPSAAIPHQNQYPYSGVTVTPHNYSVV